MVFFRFGVMRVTENLGFFFRLFVFVGNGKGSQVGSREKLLRSWGCDLGNGKMLVCSLDFFGDLLRWYVVMIVVIE